MQKEHFYDNDSVPSRMCEHNRLRFQAVHLTCEESSHQLQVVSCETSVARLSKPGFIFFARRHGASGTFTTEINLSEVFKKKQL